MAARASLKSVAAALAVTMFAALPASAETKGPVTDEAGVVVAPEGEPLQIGSFLSALGIDARRGIEIALDKIGTSYKGHPIEIVYEDETCSPPGRPDRRDAPRLSPPPSSAHRSARWRASGINYRPSSRRRAATASS
jgi:hypothetical protein